MEGSLLPQTHLEATATISEHRRDNQGIEKPPQDRSAPRYTSLEDFKCRFPKGIMYQKTSKPLISTPRFVIAYQIAILESKFAKASHVCHLLPIIRDQLPIIAHFEFVFRSKA